MGTGMVRELALWAIALNLVGVLGLFAFGAPFRIPLGGADIVVLGSSPRGQKIDLAFAILAWLSLLCVIVGSALQAYTVWLTP